MTSPTNASLTISDITTLIFAPERGDRHVKHVLALNACCLELGEHYVTQNADHIIEVVRQCATWSEGDKEFKHNYEPIDASEWYLDSWGQRTYRSIAGARRAIRAMLRSGGYPDKHRFKIVETRFVGKSSEEMSHVNIYSRV